MREAWYVPYAPTPLSAERVLVLAPHPDDEVFGCGGALALLAQAGAKIEVVIATQGPQAALRLEESSAAAALLGYPAPDVWEFADRGLEATREPLTEQLLARLHTFKPTLLFAPACWEMHPDHRAACDAALQAGHTYAREQGAPLRIALYEVGVPLSVTDLVDITGVAGLKQQAMQCFTSQLAEQRYADQIAGLNTYRSYTLGMQITAAEAYHIIDAATPYAELPLPSQQDIALHRCEKAYQAALAEQQQLIQQVTASADAQARCQAEKAQAEATLQAIYASRGWRWLTVIKRMLGRT